MDREGACDLSSDGNSRGSPPTGVRLSAVTVLLGPARARQRGAFVRFRVRGKAIASHTPAASSADCFRAQQALETPAQKREPAWRDVFLCISLFSFQVRLPRRAPGRSDARRGVGACHLGRRHSSTAPKEYPFPRALPTPSCDVVAWHPNQYYLSGLLSAAGCPYWFLVGSLVVIAERVYSVFDSTAAGLWVSLATAALGPLIEVGRVIISGVWGWLIFAGSPGCLRSGGSSPSEPVVPRDLSRSFLFDQMPRATRRRRSWRACLTCRVGASAAYRLVVDAGHSSAGNHRTA